MSQKLPRPQTVHFLDFYIDCTTKNTVSQGKLDKIVFFRYNHTDFIPP